MPSKPPKQASRAPVSIAQDHSKRRDRNQAWRSWYKTKRWQELRDEVLARDHYTCRMCGHMNLRRYGLHCDHVEKHGGDYHRFWSGPFQTLCQMCHNKHKQRIERGTHPRL